MREALLLAALGGLLASGCAEKTADDKAGKGAEQAAQKAAEGAGDKAGEGAAGVQIDPAMLAAFGPLPEVMAAEGRELTDAKIDLGRMLYHDTRLSKNHDISCNSCHQLDKYGVDNEPTSPGHKKQLGGRNSPTVYNAAGHIAQFWDGRAADIEEQAKGPILNPVEMAMPGEAQVLETLRSMPGYVDAFQKAFPGVEDPISYDNFAVAVGAFERKLVTPGRWDAFLGGKSDALTDAEKQGLKDFVAAGCTTCHSGPYMGGQMYQKVGLVEPWPNQKDQGRFEVTGKDADKMMFKVPSLRNIAKTGPYFHDGSVADLGEAVKLMAKHQLGQKLDDKTTASIVTFLEALTGELPTAYIAKPELPASTDKTPKPDPT